MSSLIIHAVTSAKTGIANAEVKITLTQHSILGSGTQNYTKYTNSSGTVSIPLTDFDSYQFNYIITANGYYTQTGNGSTGMITGNYNQ